jgi:hypothetical protein
VQPLVQQDFAVAVTLYPYRFATLVLRLRRPTLYPIELREPLFAEVVNLRIVGFGVKRVDGKWRGFSGLSL